MLYIILQQPTAGEALMSVLLEAKAVGGVSLQSAAGIVEVVVFLCVSTIIKRYVNLQLGQNWRYFRMCKPLFVLIGVFPCNTGSHSVLRLSKVRRSMSKLALASQFRFFELVQVYICFNNRYGRC